MDPKILDILVCPLCKGPLFYQPENPERLVCKADKLAYPIKEGIPVMIAEEATPLINDEHN